MGDAATLPVTLAAAFVAGALNAVAGGGSFLTLPALIFAGVPPVAANATGTLALLPGYVAGAWGFRDRLRPPAGLGLGAVALISVLGGGGGALLLLVTPNHTFRTLIPWLLLLATLLFALGPWVVARLRGAVLDGKGGVLALLAVCLYGGYFNGGLGILLLAVLGVMGEDDLAAMNGLKNVISAILTVIAVVLYAGGGVIAWDVVGPMAGAAALGGYAGARVARRLPPRILRAGIIATGATMTALFFRQG